MVASACFICIFVIVTFASVITSSSVLDNLHYVGCYESWYSLLQKYHHHIPAVTLTKCVELCLTSNTKFAGIETSDNFCYCGGDIAEESVRRNDTLCNIPCRDQSIRTCGGDWLISLYELPGGNVTDPSVNVDFLLGLSTGVRLYHSKENSNYETLMTTPDWSYAVDYHYSKNIIYAYTKKKIYRGSLQSSGGSINPIGIPGQEVKDTSPCDGFAVDWVHDRIYWGHCNRNDSAIKVMGLDGDGEQTVLSTQELNDKVIKRMVVDPYKGMIFWTADGVIQSCQMSGEGFVPNVTNVNVSVRALALDMKLRRVYYVGFRNQSNALMSMSYTGEDEVEHFSIPQFKSVYGIGIIGDTVFWVNYANVRDVIYQASINLTSSEDVKMIKTIDRAVWHMKLVHPSLQRRPTIDRCLDKSCAYKCVVRGVSATCECPPGQTLSNDGVSCDIVEGHNPTQLTTPQPDPGASRMLVVSVFVVLAILLVSLGLMYVVDRYRSLLELKLFGVAYSRSSDRANVNEVDRDTVNLV